MATLPTTTRPRLTPRTVPSGPIIASPNFYVPPPDNSPPFTYVDPPPPGQPYHNHILTPTPIHISDIRVHASPSDFALSTHSFAALSSIPSACPTFTSSFDPSIPKIYYPEVEALLLTYVPGATRIHIFDHTLRSTSTNSNRTPVTRVHIDQTPASAAARIRRHLPHEASTLLRHRYRIINVWRPLNAPVESWPLAIADRRTVPRENLVEVEMRAKDRKGETWGVKHDEGMQWWYWSGMKNDERLLVQCFDSEMVREGGGGAPHVAVDVGTGRMRESIEIRALVFDEVREFRAKL